MIQYSHLFFVFLLFRKVVLSGILTYSVFWKSIFCVLIYVTLAPQSAGFRHFSPEPGSATIETVRTFSVVSASGENENKQFAGDDFRVVNTMNACICANHEIRMCPSIQTSPSHFPDIPKHPAELQT
jgi:hypothetical protein